LPTIGKGRGPCGNRLIKTRKRQKLTTNRPIGIISNGNKNESTITTTGELFSNGSSIPAFTKNTSDYQRRQTVNGPIIRNFDGFLRLGIFDLTDPWALKTVKNKFNCHMGIIYLSFVNTDVDFSSEKPTRKYYTKSKGKHTIGKCTYKSSPHFSFYNL
jgi:hypothetical protein